MMDVLYVNRVSTDNKEQDPRSNLLAVENFCKFKDLKIVAKLIDHGVSGSVPYTKRKESKKIDEYIKKYKSMNKPLGVVVFSIDRFTRQHPVEALNAIYKLESKGLKIFSASESVFNDESEYALPMQFNLLWFNYYFLVQHSKKVKAGNETRRAKGLHTGRALVKGVEGYGKNKKYIYYSKEELKHIHARIHKLSKKLSYIKVVETLMREDNVCVSKSYVGTTLKEK